MTTTAMIESALKAKVDETKPALNEEDTNEFHRLVALWVAKCEWPQVIVENAELNTLLARMPDLCKSRHRYALPCSETVTDGSIVYRWSHTFRIQEETEPQGTNRILK